MTSVVQPRFPGGTALSGVRYNGFHYPVGHLVNRYQKIALAVAAANLLLILAFPPVDQYSIAASKLPVFAGFYFALSLPPNAEINTAVLWLELMVVLVNGGIGWLLMRDKRPDTGKLRLSLQNAVLAFTGVNLVLVVLFPPFESVFALTQAVLPNFEGFYFIFLQMPNHVIVTSLLYIEATFLLVNGGFLWLLLRPPTGQERVAEQLRDFAGVLGRKK